MFIPEIYNEGSQFLEKDKSGKSMSKPCQIEMSEYHQAPSIFFQEEYISMLFYIKLRIQCVNSKGVMENVIDLETSSLVEFKI